MDLSLGKNSQTLEESVVNRKVEKYGLIGIKTKNPEEIWMKPGQNQLV
jgi:hypothetical protein